jgi:hypothetical protein
MWEIVEGTSNLLIGWVKVITEIAKGRRENHEKDFQRDRDHLRDAFHKLGQAAILTRAYLADVDLRGRRAMEGDGGALSAEMRERLSTLWLDVSQELTHFHGVFNGEVKDNIRRLVERCFDKAQYWANPGGWKGSKAEINLDKLVEEVRTALLDLG